MMKINLYQMKIPFNFSFGHGAAKRTTSDSFILKLESDEGLVGFADLCCKSFFFVYICWWGGPGVNNTNIFLGIKCIRCMLYDIDDIM